MTGAELVRELWERFEARDWEGARALLADDFVSEWPHSLERMPSADDYIGLNRNYPEGWAIRVDRVIEAGDTVLSETTVTQGDTVFNVAAVFEVRDGKLVRAREYWVEAGSETHPERVQWTEPLSR